MAGTQVRITTIDPPTLAIERIAEETSNTLLLKQAVVIRNEIERARKERRKRSLW